MSKNVTSELKQTAGQWFVRRRAEDFTDAEGQAFNAWIAEDDSHASAYRMVEQEWKDLQELESWAADELRELETRVLPPKRRWNIFQLLSGFAVTAAMAVMVFMLVSPTQEYEIQHYSTMKGEQRKIVLEDGSRVHLNSSSAIKVLFTDEEREIRLQSGEGLFDVAHERNRPFIVKVGKNKVVAVGTSFSVHVNKEKIAVTVLEGRVAIVPVEKPVAGGKTGQPLDTGTTGLLLEPDQQAHVSRDGKVDKLETVDAEKVTAWNRGLLILDNTPLREVAEEISRYIVGNVQVADNVPDHPVTGVIKITDQETMFQLLSEVVPITPVRQSSQLTMLYSSEASPALFQSN